LLDAGRHFLRRQGRSTDLPESELVAIAVRSLGLDELAPFKPAEQIIEYLLRDPAAGCGPRREVIPPDAAATAETPGSG
jgi:glutamate formiminotransferase/formiminotetrahydrofolate cyclodeaminase